MCLCCEVLQLFLAVTEFLNAFSGVSHVEVGRFESLPNASEPALHVLQFCFDGLQPPALLVCQTVHLLVEDTDEATDVALGEDILAEVADDRFLERLGVDARRRTGPAALLEDGLADVVGVLAALGFGCSELLSAESACGQPAEQVGA
ncbi:MAG: hypothetical protein OXC55_02525 [Chloroflexi bacterium]|nr:hypothetical protein [Chloroflexota bacterium]